MYKLATLCSVLNLIALATLQDTIDNDRSRNHDWRLKVTPDFGCFKEGSSASIYCLNITNHITTFARSVYWIKLTNDKFSQGRILSYDHQLHFHSVSTSDEGSYCCRLSQSSKNTSDPPLHGCTGSSTTRISAAAADFLKNTSTISCVINSDHRAVARSLDTGKACKLYRYLSDSRRCMQLACYIQYRGFHTNNTANHCLTIQLGSYI